MPGIAAFFGLWLATVGVTAGQGLFRAWVPPRGEASFSLDYSNAAMHDHYFGTGDAFDVGHIRTNMVLVELEYALTDRLVVGAGLPYTVNKYYGPIPHSLLDDGEYHGTFQDYRFQARYQVIKAPLLVTPFLGSILPSHGYGYYAHSAAGFDLRELPVGVDLGRRLDPILPSAWVSARYAYVFVERVAGIRHDRSEVAMELGDYVTPSLAVRTQAYWQTTHGGIAFPENPSEIFAWPHRVAREDFVDVGAGLVYSLTGTVDVSGTWWRTVSGRSVPAVRQGLTFGFTWNFSPEQIARRAFRSGEKKP